MRCELPQFKRCCFCLPLRHGLIAWGYIKLITEFLIFVIASYTLLDTFYSLELDETNDIISQKISISDMIYTGIILLIFVMDFMLTMVYVIGGHAKNVKLLRVFYYYSQVIWILMVLLMAVSVGFTIESVLSGIYHSIYRWIWLATNISFYFVNVAVQTYFLLLLRSEILKLNSNCEFRFVNNAADAECTMTRKDDVTGENVIETA